MHWGAFDLVTCLPQQGRMIAGRISGQRGLKKRRVNLHCVGQASEANTMDL